MRGMSEAQEDRIKKEFGAHIRAIRQGKRFSQESLAHACGLDRTYIGGIERGERNVSLINIYKVAKALGVAPKELLP